MTFFFSKSSEKNFLKKISKTEKHSGKKSPQEKKNKKTTLKKTIQQTNFF